MDQDPQDNRSSTNNTYQPQYHWLSPLRDIETGIFNPETGLNLEDNPISGIDPELFTKRATNTSAMAVPSTHTNYLYPDTQVTNHTFAWPTISATNVDLTSNRTSLQTDAHWPAYQGLNTRTTTANTKTPSTNFAYPTTTYSLDQLPKDHDSTGRQSRHHNHRNQQTNYMSSSKDIQV